MSATTWEAVLTLPVTPGRDHTLGPQDAPVELVEYGDYECPYCAAANPMVKQVLEAAGGDVLFSYRQFPLTTMHPHAFPAAEAAEAAGAQGRYWEMHDLLYVDQHHLADPDLVARARQLGLDTDRFAADLERDRFASKVHEDFLSGVRSGVNGTPTFFVNGVRYDGGVDPAGLLAAIERARAGR